MKTVSTQDHKRDLPQGSTGQQDAMVSIIIVNYNTREYLRACLASIFKGEKCKYQVIVVDNGSADDSANMVARDFPAVHLMGNEVNAGFAKANNMAWREARGKYTLLLNSDTEVSDSTIETLIRYMEANQAVSAAGCKVLYPDGRIQLSCGYFPTLSSALWGGQAVNLLFKKFFPRSSVFGACGLGPRDLEQRREVDILLGACVILRNDVVKKIGLFDEKMFMYFEECDLFQRIKAMGGKVMYLPDTTIIHHAGGSVKNLAEAVGNYQASQEYYFRKHVSLKKLIWFRILIITQFL